MSSRSVATTLTLGFAVVVLGSAAAGCGSSRGHAAATQTVAAPRPAPPCKLNRAQRHTVALALADIQRLRRIQAPVQTFSERGAPNQVQVTGKLELDLGSSHLPLNVFSRLLHLGKTAVSLCGDCSNALEAEEPVLGNRPGTTHTGAGNCR